MRTIHLWPLVLAATLLAGCSMETPAVQTGQPVDTSLTFPNPSPPPAEPAPPTRTSPSESNSVTTKKMYNAPPQMTIDATKTYTATLQTDAGDIVIALTAKETPITVNNFVFLARDHFYDGTVFHRVIKDFMIQGGDPKGDGTGGTGYSFADEPFTGAYTRGTVAMANAGPNTNGSQFFIMHGEMALPPSYVIFGQVTGGMNAVDAIAGAPVRANLSGENSAPVTPVVIRSVTITEK